MATIVASLQSSCCSQQHLRKPKVLTRSNRSFVAKNVPRPSVEDVDRKIPDKPNLTVADNKDGLMDIGEDLEEGMKKGGSANRFHDERWKNGTWDLNMFVKNGKLDWNGVIEAEARRRRHLEMYPEPATNEAPVTFSASIIPWWAWLIRFHLPEAELLNGRAAMMGFFMAYFVDSLTGIGVVDQTSNYICKALLFSVVTGILVFWQTDDSGNLKQLTEEATFYNKQWRATWEDQQTPKSSEKD